LVASRGVNIVRPRSATRSLTAEQVAKAYNFPKPGSAQRTVAIIELGGAVNKSDLRVSDVGRVQVVAHDGAKPQSDGPDGADGEVMLDVEVVLEAAPNAKVLVIFAPNTDQGFYDAFDYAFRTLHAGDAISCSWGGPEDAWDQATVAKYDALFALCKQANINVFCASGDQGSSDGEVGNHVDFPASSPNVVACGGTELTVDSNGQRSTEVTWNVNSKSSATGGGDSVYFLGRAVPDVAGNASPTTGYEVVVDGTTGVIGGTSAVAPLMAALAVNLSSVAGPFDFQRVVTAYPEVCFDVTAGDNGAFRAGPGRDKVTGFGVPDGAKMLGVLTGTVPQPVPVVPPVSTDPLADFPFKELDTWAAGLRSWWPTSVKKAVAAYRAWRQNHPSK
jgi:kumamolisin